MPTDSPPTAKLDPAKPRHLGRRALLGLGILGLMTVGTGALMYSTIEPDEAFASDPDAARRQALLSKITSWSALARLDAGAAPAFEPAGLLLINADAIAELEIAAAQERLEELQRLDAGARRLVVAALSTSESAKIDVLLTRGIDGVFLDARAAMLAAQPAGAGGLSELAVSIVRLANQARLINPDFLLVLHNASELTADPRVARVIDGAAQDNLLYGLDGVGVANGRTEVVSALHDLNRVKRSGRPVFIAESLEVEALIARTGARRKLAELGFIARIAEPKRPS